MKHSHELRLNRRQWLLATTAALTGCGGGGGGVVGALPGTGGTGIGVQGPITGFGSVIVNSTKYDDSTASVYLDGALQTNSAGLRVGMVANISGALDAGGTSGSATRIDVWSIASGVVGQVDVSGSSFTMVGMDFSTDAATSFEGLANLAAISVGTSLTVWGQQISADAHAWRATRVKLLPLAPTMIVTTGLFDGSGSTPMLNGFHLSGSGLRNIANGQLLRVEGTFSLANMLSVTKATPIAATQQVASTGMVELEGVVTAFTSATDFYVGTTRVDASKVSPNSGVGANSSVEVAGSLQNGVLIASRVEVKSGSSRTQIDITGVVETYTSLSNFEVRGQKCDASTATVTTLGTSTLQKGTKVHVIGTSQGHETLLVQSIEVGVP